MAEPAGWTCFHCGKHFDNIKCAETHFGTDESRDPGCVEKLKGGDLGLLRRVRELEEQLIPYLSETSAVENYVHGLKDDHGRALIHAEQEGYDKGLRDGRELVAPQADASARMMEAAEWLMKRAQLIGGQTARSYREAASALRFLAPVDRSGK